MKTYSFPRGGIFLEDATVPVPRGGSCAVAFLPALSLIPLVQYPGGRLTPLVSVGDSVREGMLVGMGGEGGASNVHATVPGRVVRHAEWEDGEGRERGGLLIQMEGSFDRLGATEEGYAPELPPDLMSHRELAETLDRCGIVEMEGSGRPLSRMISGFCLSDGPRTLVVRCVFDDPWLVADRVLCGERLKAVVEGGFLLAGACGGVGRVVFAVSRKDRKLGEAMLAEAAGYGIPSSMVLTGGKYPQRNRREMEIVLRDYGRRTRADLGTFLMLGPSTLAAVHDAVKYRRPILERYVAVGGSAVREPRVMRVRVGKRIGDLFEECGGFVGSPCRVVTGSPFFGEPVRYLDEPVTRTSYALVAMLAPQVGGHPVRGCISCGECRKVCPVGLDPEEMYKMIKVTAPDGGPRDHPGFRECHGCGCCQMVCPSRLPLPEEIRGQTPYA
ncbi:MAG: 4Fe-4S dicluster domain-containing protein [Treponema sp.]|nr:4Fe-4S dicluster domain-containing protein [Treponema sp.]